MNHARGEAWDTVRAAEKELAGLIQAKRNLEASVQAEQDSCGSLQGQINKSKNEQGRLRNEVGTLETELLCLVESYKKHAEEIFSSANLSLKCPLSSARQGTL